RVNRAICTMFSGMSLDAGYGKRLPSMMSRCGLDVSHVEARSHLERGGDPVAMMMAESTQALRDRYIATEEANSDDVDTYIRAVHDPKSWATYYATVGVIANNQAKGT